MAVAYYRDLTTGQPMPLWGSDLNKSMADTLYVAKTGDTMSGVLVANAGAAGLVMKPGATDTAYIQFNARTASPESLSGLLGFNATSAHMEIRNSLADGNIKLTTQGAGRLVLSADPTGGMHAVTKQYTDNHPWAFAPGVKQLAGGTDLNLLGATGFYDVSSPVNAPSGAVGWWYVEVLGHSNDPTLHTYQRVTGLTEAGVPVTWARRKYSGTWSAWEKQAGASEFVAKAGDAMTGELVVKGVQVGAVWDNSTYRGIQVQPISGSYGSGSALMLGAPSTADPHTYLVSNGDIILRPKFNGAKQVTITEAGATVPGHLKVGTDSGAVTNPGDLGVAYIDAKYGGSFGGEEVWNVKTPTDPASAANKAYVDARVMYGTTAPPAQVAPAGTIYCQYT